MNPIKANGYIYWSFGGNTSEAYLWNHFEQYSLGQARNAIISSWRRRYLVEFENSWKVGPIFPLVYGMGKTSSQSWAKSQNNKLSYQNIIAKIKGESLKNISYNLELYLYW